MQKEKYTTKVGQNERPVVEGRGVDDIASAGVIVDSGPVQLGFVVLVLRRAPPFLAGARSL